jgi:hypothetical protein
MGEEMTAASTVVKTEARLEQCLDKLAELRERYGKVRLSDTATWTNQTLSYVRAVGDMLVLAEAIARAASSARRAGARTTAPTTPSATTRTSGSVGREVQRDGVADVEFERGRAGPRRAAGPDLRQATPRRPEKKEAAAAS